MSGFITMQREAVEHPLFAGDSARLGAWIWMLAKACWKPTKFNVQGRTISLERGQFCCSVREMAEAWGWSKSAVGRFLTRLKTDTMIGTETGTGSGTGRLIVTIRNYSKYQDLSQDGGTGNGTQDGTPSGTAAGQQRDIKEPRNQGTKEDSPQTPQAQTRKKGEGDYTFAGKTIRLTQSDFDRWKTAYHAIPDIVAELTGIDDWLDTADDATRKRWFHAVSRMLGRKHEAALASSPSAKVAAALASADAASRRLERFEAEQKAKREQIA